MGCSPVCCVALCLLAAGLVDSGVTQTPRYLIKARGQRGTLRCSPVSGHLSAYWYQQALGLGPKFLVEYYRQEVRGEAQLPDRFSVKQFSDFRSELYLSSLELTDSAVYLCASSQDTALHDQVPLGQKHSCPSSGSGCEGTACLSGLDRSDRLSQTFCLCCVLMLPKIMLGAVHAGVTQDPRCQVVKTGQKATLKCTQDLGHDRMYWYRKDPERRLRLIHYSAAAPTTEKGDMPEGYSVSRPSTENFALTLESANRSQTSVYFCASSYSTELHGHLISVQKDRGSTCKLLAPGTSQSWGPCASSVTLDGFPGQAWI